MEDILLDLVYMIYLIFFLPISEEEDDSQYQTHERDRQAHLAHYL